MEIKPDYAPAVLSLGSVEYQRERKAAGHTLFLSLLSMPDDAPDWVEIVDAAGDFLIQSGEYADALELYRGAAARAPAVGVFHQGIGCCASHLGQHEEALAASRRAVAARIISPAWFRVKSLELTRVVADWATGWRSVGRWWNLS